MKRYKISEIAKMKHVKTETLRYYDEIGLLKPHYIDETTGYRYYSSNQFMDVDIIKFYKLIGMSLKEIKETLAITDLRERLARIRKQNDLFLSKINDQQKIVNEMNGVIERIERAQKEYDLLGDTPILMIKDPLYGYVEDVDKISNAYEMETHLYNLTERHQLNELVQHNQGIISIGSIEKLLSGEAFTEKIILRNTNKRLEEYPIGLCVRAYQKGGKEKIYEIVTQMQAFIKRENLVSSGQIIICTIVDSFIVDSKEEDFVELMIPVSKS